jgi:hypothetical protein
MYLSGGVCSLTKGLSSHLCRTTLTNKFNLIKATKFDKYQAYFACFFSAFNISLVINVVHTYIITAL